MSDLNREEQQATTVTTTPDDQHGREGEGSPRLSRRSLLLAAGSVALLPIPAVRSSDASAASPTGVTPAAVPAASTVALISLPAGATGVFRRVRAADDDTRLHLRYPSGIGNLVGQQTAAAAFYGLDFSAYPAGSHARQHLQDLFDNTPFGYLGFYFKTTGHPGRSWVGKASELLAQGWNLLPIYVGRQQYWPHTTNNQISPKTKTATRQGTTDGRHAVALAAAEKLPLKSKLYLDVEATQYPSGANKGKNGPPAKSTIAYIRAWLAAVDSSKKFTGALYDANSRWKSRGKTYYDAVQINAELGTDTPATWVAWDPGVSPVGVDVGTWPLDPNGDIAAVAVKSYSNKAQWKFANFAQSWQFKLDWQPTGTAFLSDTGAPRDLASIARRVDLDASKTYDPGNTAPGRAKIKRRPRVSSITTDSATVKAGKSVRLRVALDRQAPSPNGALVLLRCTSPDLVLPTSLRVGPGASSGTVIATAAVGSGRESVTVEARVLHQLSGTPADLTLQIAP